MDFEKLTIKSGEAVAGAQELARRAGNPELTPDHLTIALLDQELPRTLCERAGLAPERYAPTPSVGSRSSRPSPAARPSRRLPPPSGGFWTTHSRKRTRWATSSSRSSTCCSRSSSSRVTRCSGRSRRSAAASV